MSDFEELKSTALDVSQEFTAMPYLEFHDFLRRNADKAVLVLKYRMTGNYGEDSTRLTRLTKFLDHCPVGQKRFAFGIGTQEDYNKHIEKIAYGIKWENSQLDY